MAERRPRRVSLLALPESIGTPISGIYETLTFLGPATGADGLLEVEIVGPRRGLAASATGLPLQVHRSVEEVDRTDIVVMASMLVDDQEWVTGRHPEIVEWLRDMHAGGADLASACAGALLLAETGLLDGGEATTHWAFAPTFRRNFPEVRLRVEELLLVGGRDGELVMSGAASSWQDLILFLISRHASPDAAREIGRFLLYQWNTRSQAPFIPFTPGRDHGDALIGRLQRWLEADPGRPASVDEMAERAGIAPSSLRRRFTAATGYPPRRYLQHVRIEQAKRLLEGTDRSVEDVCWAVGYRQPAAFRRLFRSLTSLSPSEYRRKFRPPWYAEPPRPGAAGG